MSVCLSTYLSDCRSVCRYICPSICLLVIVCPSFNLSILCLSVVLSFHLMFYLSVSPSFCLSMYLTVCHSVCLSLLLSLYLYYLPFICLSFCLSIILSVFLMNVQMSTMLMCFKWLSGCLQLLGCSDLLLRVCLLNQVKYQVSVTFLIPLSQFDLESGNQARGDTEFTKREVLIFKHGAQET